LIWAACGKDPGLSPSFILEEARRSARYTQEEISELDFQGPLPDAALLAAEWKAAMKEADLIHATMPPESAGCCVLGKSCELFRGDSSDLANVFSKGGIVFHKGSIRGAWPTIKTEKAPNH
jgi:hypothetical protein